MAPCTNVITVVNVGHGFFVWTRTVYGSTISTRSIGAKNVAPRSLPCPCASRSSENFAESALNSSPLWNFTPLRSLTSHVVGATSFGSSAASDGWILRFASRSTSVSKMWRPTLDAGLSDWFIMSSVEGSTPCASTILPSGAPDAASGVASISTSTSPTRQAFIGKASSVERDSMPSVRDVQGCSPATLGIAIGRVKVRERLVTRAHETERLRLARPAQQRSDRRPGAQAEARHDIVTPEQRRGGDGGALLRPTR